LLPLAFYLVFLGQNHQQGRIRVFSGRSDLIRLWGGLAGLIILGGPRFLAWLYRQLVLNSIADGGPEPLYLLREVWVAIFGVYPLIVGWWGYSLWKARERLTVVYSGSAELVRQALENLSLDSHFDGSTATAQPSIASRPERPSIVEERWLQVVEIAWPENLLPWKEKYEAMLDSELARVQVRPGVFWALPVTFGLAILFALAGLNLLQAWVVFRQAGF